jgi:hypothetical protein
MLAVTYPFWSMLPMLYFFLGAYLVLLVTWAAGAEVWARYQANRTEHKFGGRHGSHPRPA